MRYKIIAHVEVEMEHFKGDKKSKLISTGFNLDVSKNLAREEYFTPDDLPNANGTKSLTVALVMGLAANIHQAHENGYRDSAEHLRYIMAELEKAFVAIPTVTKGHFGDEA